MFLCLNFLSTSAFSFILYYNVVYFHFDIKRVLDGFLVLVPVNLVFLISLQEEIDLLKATTKQNRESTMGYSR